ncbi:acyltransferase [Caulobacter soli]|uniref:acyltransferase n=1 Tax=Caulobacter soli TaxID=2708539 RepID=UPI0013EB4247|nr:acyltransferase [Caulobacter soli]
MTVLIHPTAEVHPLAKLGKGVKIWNNAQVRERAVIGDATSIGKNAFVDIDVNVGSNCKIQNNVSVYLGATVEDGVLLGPHCVLLNDRFPRAINADGSFKSADDWVVSGVTVRYGASIGGAAVLTPGVTIGRWALVGAGSVVAKDVPEHALVVGNPARVIGYISPAGRRMSVVGRDGDRVFLSSPCGFELEISEVVNPV